MKTSVPGSSPQLPVKTPSVFITGTDTGVGKTHVSVALTRGLRSQGLRVSALKPIAAGCEWLDEGLCNKGWRNDDALQLQAAAGHLSYEQVNPIALAQALAPHIAAQAQEQQQQLSVAATLKAMQPGLAVPADVQVIEGAGGWLVPLNELETFADLALALTGDIILVVGMRLGALNHALLTAQMIRAQGGRLLGFVANQCQAEPMAAAKQNLDYLTAHLNAPLLANFVWGPSSADQEVALAQALLAQMPASTGKVAVTG